MTYRRGPTPAKKSTKNNQKSIGARDALVRKVRASIISGANLEVEIARLKMNTHPLDLFSLFPRIFNDERTLEMVYGPAFPVNPSEIFSRLPIYKPANPLVELVWAICRSIKNAGKISKFNLRREEFEKEFIADEGVKATTILDSIESEFGWSAWLIQARLFWRQRWEGIEAGRKYLTELDQKSISPVPKFIATYVARRIEATGLQKHLKDELRDRAKLEGNRTFEQFAVSKVFDMWDIHTDNVAPLLFYDAQFSQIDHYESLVAVLQSAASDQTIPEELAVLIKEPIRILFERTKDRRILGVMLALGYVFDYEFGRDIERAKLIESYSQGNYAQFLHHCNGYLIKNCDDVAIHLLQVKADVNSKNNLHFDDSTLGKIKLNYKKILCAEDDFYSAAYNLVTTLERFNGQAWINHLRAAVQLELREDDGIFPPVYMRDIYVRDRYITPFTKVIARGAALKFLEEEEELHSLFPFTSAVYTAAVEDFEPEAFENNRMQYYSAIRALNNGEYSKSIRGFNRVLQTSHGITRFRAINGAVLGYLGNNEIKAAVKLVINCFLENSNAASLLPLRAIISNLEDPISWPNCIETPLIFELYHNYVDTDKLQHLRLAFEQFQIENNCTEPSQLVVGSDISVELITEYMKRVWRPEIMLQTILYKGTKQIEDARIKVCQILAEIDPENSAEYLLEVRDRVKKQEIAGGIILVESSKVYVDIEAIRAVLNKRLRDSYSRYKSNTQDKENPLIYKISNIIQEHQGKNTNTMQEMMATLHLLDVPNTEEDEQFSAIFLEVTHEFLRGDYGLNAYLSTRVRHGKLVNALRKFIAEENLVTSRTQDRKAYLENTFWRGHDAEDEMNWRKIRQRLEIFAFEFDNTIENVRDNLIQIRIQKDLKVEKNDALFIYPSSNIERMFFKEIDRKSSTVDELIGMCVEMLWRKTDTNLLRVQSTLNDDVRNSLRLSFDTLASDLSEQFSNVCGINELLNAIARARTETNKMLNHVIGWFKRNAVYDRQDYSPEFPVHISQNMLNRTIAGLNDWDGVSVETESDAKVPGRTLDSIVELYHCLLENALKHSGLTSDDLKVSISTEYKQGKFSSIIVNNLSPLINLPNLENKLSGIRSILQLKESSILAQADKGSGLHKISRSLNAPGFDLPRFDFFLKNDEFRVELSFDLEAVNENTIG